MSGQAPRVFTENEDALIRRAHNNEIKMHDLARDLRAGLITIYKRMEELDLPLRKIHQRSPWRHITPTSQSTTRTPT